MFESRNLSVLGKAVCIMAAVGFLTKGFWDTPRIEVSARSSATVKGEYGGDLDFLRRCWTPPETTGESNHYLDLWSSNSLPILARVNGLTNNHTLFVDSHGKAGPSLRKDRYCFYPRDSVLVPGEATPFFSAGDLAAVLGPEDSARIHNRSEEHTSE